MRMVRIIIKAANQKLDDETYEVDASWSILQLKNHISSVYPSKPTVDDQKLIYSGHLLKNEQFISNLIDNGDTTMTVHMVLNQRASDAAPKEVQTKKEPDTVNASNGSQTSETPENATNELTNENGSTNFSPEMLMNNFMANHNQHLNSEQYMQQMALMQQMFFQCMAQYMNMNQTGLAPENIFQMPVMNATSTNQALPQVTPNSGAVAVNAGANAAENIQNAENAPMVGLNAAGPGAAVLANDDEEEDIRNRDWLDWFYLASRSMVFLIMVYIYSSLGRFILVAGLGFMVYLYQNGLLNQNRRVNRETDAPVRPREEPERREMNEEQLQQAMDGDMEPNTRPNSNSDNNNNMQEVTEHSWFKVAFIMVTSLFTSLLPQPPEVVN